MLRLSACRPSRNLLARCNAGGPSRTERPTACSGEVARHVLEKCLLQSSKFYSSKSMKVAVLGAASKTGSCLSLFLKQSTLIDELAVYDNKSTYGLALELNYIDTRCKVSTFAASENCLKKTLEDAKIVMIVTDPGSKEKSDPDEVLKRNANTLSDLLPSVIRFCPRAMVAVAMNPINCLIPLAVEMLKKAGIYNFNRLFGVMTLDCIRANTFVSEIVGIDPECIKVPVIGGSCPRTCVPLFSQAQPSNMKLSWLEIDRLTKSVRMANEDLLKVNKDEDASIYALGFAAARFCVSLCKAIRHERGVVESAYVRSCMVPQLKYFAAPLELGPEGIQRYLGIPALSSYECDLLQGAIPVLKKAVGLGEVLALGHGGSSSELCSPIVDDCKQTMN